MPPTLIEHVNDNIGSLGIPVVSPRILGCESACARSHPKIWHPSRQISKNHNIEKCLVFLCPEQQFGDF
jgi:hypothetical protein